MYPDAVLIAKSLPQCVNRGHSQLGGVQRVDALVRGTAGVGGAPNVAGDLSNKSVVGDGYGHLALVCP